MQTGKEFEIVSDETDFVIKQMSLTKKNILELYLTYLLEPREQNFLLTQEAVAEVIHVN